MIFNIVMMQNYSENSVTVNNQQQFTVTDGGCKEHTSKYRKFFATWPRRKRQQQHERWDQVWDQLQHQQQVEEHAQSTSPSTTLMTMLTWTIVWCTPCVERARRAHSFTLDVVWHHIGSRFDPFAHLFNSLLPFYFHQFFPVLSFYMQLFPALPWARF